MYLRKVISKKSVLCIRIGFSPAFYLNANLDPVQKAKPMRIHPDPDPCQTLKSQTLNFYMRNFLNVGYGIDPKTSLRRYRYSSLFGRQETRFIF
jgi:hypothetical protein